jgi:ankyrin repeat protein
MTNSKQLLRGTILALLLAAAGTSAAYAQFSDSYNFLKAVKDRKGDEAEKLITEPGSVIINTRDDVSGETALHIVVNRRDLTWLNYLLGRGANPNIADKKGNSPLMLATQLNFPEGAEVLIAKKAQVDASNRSGETALIRAVQLRNATMVRLLLKAGANPDKTDNVSGKSARDYAQEDGRGNAIIAILDGSEKEPAPAKSGDLDFSGIGPGQ